MTAPAPLLRHVPEGAPLRDGGAILDRFLRWVEETGLQPYPAQEEALLELMGGRHVILQTPTGSGKSLVALGLHFKALCEGKRSFYTAPIKALVSEKFFGLCELFGAAQVGMLTGDASINWAAPIICCTAEVLSNLALRSGERADAPYVVMDEFHYYGDRDRGVAWQIPLLRLPRTTFLLMSATLGNTAHIEERLRSETGRDVSHVYSDERPVPLDYDYRETPIQQTIESLVSGGRAPVYVVNFTQRECAELAQALTSARVADRDLRERIAEAVGGFRFDTPYGRDIKRFVSHGVGIHHAGLLPKYRLLIEQLAQQALLRVICGTDTLGVGVNVPIRTVLLSKLAKYDGQKVRLLSAREFKQITGRAGRRGFDTEGSVVCQAPEHVIERRKTEKRDNARGRKGGGKAKRKGRSRPPDGFVGWGRETLEQLVTRPPERLVSQFRVDHGMIVNALQQDREDPTRRGGYGLLTDLIDHCHESPARKRRLRRELAERFRSLRRARIVSLAREPHCSGSKVVVDEELQRNFSLYQTLSLYLVEALGALDPEHPEYPLDVLSLVEAALDDPVPILRAQVKKARGELIAKLKAQRVPYEERIAKLDDVTYPKPLSEFVYSSFDLFCESHPWAAEKSIHPKSIAREMVEGFHRFDFYVKRYDLQRIEGRLLRYLNEVYGTLVRSVPDTKKSDGVHEILAYLRDLIARVDSSLLEEWESLMQPAAAAAKPTARPKLDLSLTPKAFRARVRTELQALVRALAGADYEEAARCIHPSAVADGWDASRFESELAPFLAQHERVLWTPDARNARYSVLKPAGPRVYQATQALLDPEGDNDWCLEGEIDVREDPPADEPLFRIHRIGT